MAQVISIEGARSARINLRLLAPPACSAKLNPAVDPVANREPASRESVYRAILLLDLAAQRSRLLLKKISDPARRSEFESQIATIEQSIDHARYLASKL